MINSSSAHPQVPAAAAPARLIESGVELVRAEIAVAVAKSRQALLRAFTALLATILATALLQVALVVGVLSPWLLQALPRTGQWIALGLPAALALASAWTAAVCWLRALRSGEGVAAQPAQDSTPSCSRGAAAPLVPVERQGSSL